MGGMFGSKFGRDVGGERAAGHGGHGERSGFGDLGGVAIEVDHEEAGRVTCGNGKDCRDGAVVPAPGGQVK